MKRNLILTVFLFSTPLFADRIAGSQYTQAKIISIEKCKFSTQKRLLQTKIKIQAFNNIIESNISSHTKITKDNKKISCSYLKAGQTFKLGYAWGNDIANIKDDYLIIDSIKLL